MNQTEQINIAKRELVKFGQSMFERGLTPGASANMSVRCGDVFVVTPTNSCIGYLDINTLSVVTADGALISGHAPSKEFLLHNTFYRQQTDVGAVIHLHSTYATALSCLAGLDEDDAIAPLTPYLRMRLGAIAIVPFYPPGQAALIDAVERKAKDFKGILMANHGPIVAAQTLEKAMFAMEELEESAKLQLILAQQKVNLLTDADIEFLQTGYSGKL